MDGYVSTNVTVFAPEGSMANYTIKLFSERYFDAVKEARQAFAAGKFVEAQKSLATALEAEPNDPAAELLGREVAAEIEAQKKLQLAAEQQAAKEKARAIAAQFQALDNLHPWEIVRYCWNSEAEPFPQDSSVQVGAAALPVYAATAVVATGIKVAFSPLKLLSKSRPRFVQSRFQEGYSKTCRYFGIIANVDQGHKTIVFETYNPSSGSKVSASGGNITLSSGNMTKTSIAVVAHVQGELSKSPVSLEVGKPIWMSGRPTSLQQAGLNFPAANQLTLDDCVIYSPSIIPPDK
jgi:hypothetical protein